MPDNCVLVIPPYLLQTCVGLELQRELELVDPTLAKRNFFPIGSKKYRFHTLTDITTIPYAISDNGVMNSVILNKLRERLAAWGVLGTCPQPQSEKYLYDSYMIFRKRLDLGSSSLQSSTDIDLGIKDEQDSMSAGNSGDCKDSHVDSKSIYDQKGLGEFTFHSDYASLVPWEQYSLDELLSLAAQQREYRFAFSPYLMTDNKKTFLTSLPMYWTSLSVDKRQSTLENDLNMSVELKDGFSEIRFKLVENPPKRKNERKYFNFIADKEVNERTGIFYYEVSVQQRATKESRTTTIIQTNDESVSSGSCILFSAGFMKRFTRFSTSAGTSSSSSSSSSKLSAYIDLQEMQREILKYNRGALSLTLDSDVVNFLNGELGVSVDGSVAVSFNNSCSFAPVKHHLENNTSRTIPFSARFSHNSDHLSRELEISDLGIDIPFATTCTVLPNTDKVYTSDTVGFGVNFVTKTLFVTVNGILVKLIEEKEMEAGNPYKDTLFAHGNRPGSLFPAIGFQLSDFASLNHIKDPPETCIRTNFGQRRFRFDIDNYVQSFKAMSKVDFESEICDSIVRPLTEEANVEDNERSIRDNKEEHILLYQLVQEYLQKEGYTKTVQALKLDLRDMSAHVAKNGNVLLPDDMKKALGPNGNTSKYDPHHTPRRLIMNEKYIEAQNYLKECFLWLSNLDQFMSELRLLEFCRKVSEYLDASKRATVTESFGIERLELQKECRKMLQSDSIPHTVRDELVSILINALSKDQPGENADSSQEDSYPILDNRSSDAEKLANVIHRSIFETVDVNGRSRLEEIVSLTRKNISELSKLEDPDSSFFKMINFDAEYLT